MFQDACGSKNLQHKKTFLQISLLEKDRNAVRFVSRKTTHTVRINAPPVEVWRMRRVRFGTSRSFLLVAMLPYHIETSKDRFPTIAFMTKNFTFATS